MRFDKSVALAAFGWMVVWSGFAFVASAERTVSTAWLEDHLNDSDMRIVDVRTEITAYWEGHLPGAVYYHPDAMRLAHNGVPVMVMPTEAFAIMLGEMDITPDTLVCVYTETGDYKAPYLVWALDYIGHERSVVLEGGFGKWKAENRPITQDYPRITPTRYPAPEKPNMAVRATLDDVKKALADKSAVIVDVRATALYTGERGFWKRNGHLPGVPGHFWGDDLTPTGVWKDKETIRAAYAALGVTPDKPIITMCGQGTMSAHAYFTLKYLLGFPNVRNYDGGFSEWVNHDDLPVEKSPGVE
jgi:thiosulfate/3-mercaptopyruvate sulfurtransferase